MIGKRVLNEAVRLSGGVGVDGVWCFLFLGVRVGELIEVDEDLLLGVAFEVGEMLDGFADQAIVIRRIGELNGFGSVFPSEVSGAVVSRSGLEIVGSGWLVVEDSGAVSERFCGSSS